MKETWFVYVLRCGDGSFYAGITMNVAERVVRHNAGKGGAYTRSHLPVALVYTEHYATKGEALTREAQIKRLTRKMKKKLITKGEH